MLGNYFRYDGRIGRLDFALRGSLIAVACFVGTLLVFAAIEPYGRGDARPAGVGLAAMAALVALVYVYVVGSTAVTVQRLRDAGRPAWWAVWQLAILASGFLVGPLALLFWVCAFVWLATAPTAAAPSAST
ncbi:DUF805 domain-containing protein [Salinarimonas rosea]|uniref:DUF805 domain-containing protein n=1 Tax=Salinarimonas rosea TaxID=552063 RepID=UPI000407A646|nr:DUF805 domain-containing protein [Salinarimonas rosea]